jgi:hypothetical protein
MMEKPKVNTKDTAPSEKDELMCNYNYALNEEFDYLDRSPTDEEAEMQKAEKELKFKKTL